MRFVGGLFPRSSRRVFTWSPRDEDDDGVAAEGQGSRRE